MNVFKNITSHPASTIFGLATGVSQLVLTVALPAAAQAFVQTGGSLDWRVYATAAAGAAATAALPAMSAAIPVVAGALYAPRQPAAPPLSPLEAHRAGLLTKCDDAITAAAKEAMASEAAKLAPIRQAGPVSSPTPDSVP